MQNVQNANIQRVMNLVNLYRRKVGWESQIAKEAKADHDYWDSYQLESFHHIFKLYITPQALRNYYF
jgi:hypothetical protein